MYTSCRQQDNPTRSSTCSGSPTKLRTVRTRTQPRFARSSARTTRGIRAFNDPVVADERADVVVLTVRDGLSIIRRRSTPEA
jgi:hypothetical protein